MFIHNVRLGHATNSSSSHSLIFLPGAAQRVLDIAPNDAGSYGWEPFQLVSTEMKRDYVASAIYHRVLGMAGHDVAREVAAAWSGGGTVYPEGDGSDHESRVDLPSDWLGKGVDAEFAKAFVAFVMRDDIVVGGGNNNDEVKPPAVNVADATVLPLHDYTPVETRATNVARYDAAQDYWTIFSRETGAKMRVRFAPTGGAPTRSSMPELIDVKITDYCPFTCSYCLAPNTPVLMLDLSWKRISDVRPGDELYGFDENPVRGTKCRRAKPATVLATRNTLTAAVRITTSHGEVVCSPDHKWLMSNTHRWLHARDIKLGHKIMFTASPWTQPEKTNAYAVGYLSGLSCGDGTSRWEASPPGAPTRKQAYWSVRMSDPEPLQRSAEYLKRLGVSVPEVRLCGRPKPASGKLYKHMYELQSRSADELVKLREIVTLPTDLPTNADYARGWLAGFFDAEGSYFTSLRMSQKKTDFFLDAAEHFLHLLGFQCRKSYGSEVRLLGGRWEELRFLSTVDPAVKRKYAPVFDGGIKAFAATVTKLEHIGNAELVDITTSTSTFVAAGMMSHNCYQGSTPEGEHADYRTLENFAKFCGQHRVFEVAIGGGEPTLHPHFTDVLRVFREHGVVPNFTAKNLAWLRDAKLVKEILPLIGGFAYSADTAQDVAALATALEAAKLEQADDERYPATKRPLVRAHVQHVIGLDETPEQFETLLRTCADLKIPLTLLGFKTTGRGAAYGDRTNPGWLKILRDVAKEKYMRVGIDTVLADRYYDALIAAGVPDWCLTRADGRFSCYYDAVTGTLKPSSYEPEGGRAVPMDFQGDEYGAPTLASEMSATHFPEAYQSFAE